MDLLVNKHCYFPDPDTSIVTVILRDWVAKRIIELMSGPQTPANKKSLARFQAVDVDRMMMEPPTLWKADKMLVCVLSRKAGTMWIDQEIDKLKWDHFIDVIDPEGEFGKLDTTTPGVATKEDILRLASSLDAEDPDAHVFITNLEGSNEKALVVKSSDLELKPEIFTETFLKKYRFDEVRVEVAKKGDVDYPVLNGGLLDLSIGTMEIKEDLLLEGVVKYRVISLAAIYELLNNQPVDNLIYDGTANYDGTYKY